MAATDGTLRSGRLSALIADGDLRRVAFDGHEVLRRVREDERTQALPGVVVTS